MKWQLVFTEQYNRRAARFLKRHPDAVSIYAKALDLLAANPHHPSLRLHALKGKLTGLHSVSITLTYRITMELIVTDKEIKVQPQENNPMQTRHVVVWLGS